MSNLPNEKRLLEKMKNAIREVENEKIEYPDGDKKDLPPGAKNHLYVTKLTNTVTQHLADNMIQIPEIEETTLKFGSGDTGRQTQLILKPSDGVDKNQLRSTATRIHLLLEKLPFPTEAMIGVKHGYTGDGENDITESENFYLFLVYNVRSGYSGPSKPPGEKTEVFYNKDYSS